MNKPLLFCLLVLIILIPKEIKTQCLNVVDMNTWSQEGPLANGNWVVSGSGASVLQTINSTTTFFISPYDLYNVEINGKIRVETTTDDDFIGFVMGYKNPFGPSNDNYEFYLFDWKQRDQNANGFTALEGFTLSHYNGTIASTVPQLFQNFWGHTLNPPVCTPIASKIGNNLGWVDNTDHDFTLIYTATKMTIIIDNDTIFDIDGCFETGRFGFYNFSQQEVRYSDFNYRLRLDFNIVEDSICHEDSAQFVFMDTTCHVGLGVDSIKWDFGDGYLLEDSASFEDSILKPTHFYANPGKYDVTLVGIDSLGCSDTTIKQIYVAPDPGEYGDTTLCINSQTFDLFNLLKGTPDTGGLWYYQSSLVSSAFDPSLNQSGTYTYRVNGMNKKCLDSFANVQISLYSFLVTDLGGDQTIYCGDSVTLSVNSSLPGPFIYQWSTGDSIDSIQGKSGPYEVTIDNGSGCFGSDSIYIDHIDKPIALFDFNALCFEDSSVFIDTSIFFNNPLNLNWDFGDGNTDSGDSVIHYYATSGTYDVILKVTDDKGCIDSIEKSILISDLPTAGFLADSVCPGSLTSFTDYSTYNLNNISSWSWDFGDNAGVSTIQNPLYTYASAGNFDVLLEVTDIKGCKDTILKSVLVYQEPIALFDLNAICVKDSSAFIDTSTFFNNLVSWDWNFGDGNASSGDSVIHIYTTSGAFDVTLNITDDKGCIDSITKSIIISDLPLADFIADSVCPGSLTSFTDYSTYNLANIASWLWDFGDNAGVSIIQNPLYTYASEGNFDVFLEVTDIKGCKDTISKSVIVYQEPIALFDLNAICVKDSSVFIDTSEFFNNPVSWDWDFGDGNMGSGDSVIHTYTTSGAFDVTLNITDDKGCIDSITKSIFIEDIPTASFLADSVCPGSLTSFTDYSTYNLNNIVSWSWDFGDNAGVSTIQNPLYTYAGVGSFDVFLEVRDMKGCKDTISKSVIVHQAPIALFDLNAICVKDSSIFIDTSTFFHNPLSLEWDFGDGNMGSGDSVIHTYTTSGAFDVTLIVTDDKGCIDSITKSVFISDLPTASFLADSVCPGSLTSFTDYSTYSLSTISSWLWDFGDNIGLSTIQNPLYTYSSAGTYDVLLEVVDMKGCKDTILKSVLVHQEPIASSTVNNVCEGEITQFIDQSIVSASSIAAWNWGFGDPNSGAQNVSNQQNPTHVYSSHGSYIASMDITDLNGCLGNANINVVVYQNPLADFTAPDVCLNEPFLFTDNSMAYSANLSIWDWSFDGTGNSSNQNPIHSFPLSGSYNVELIIEDSKGCKDTIQKAVNVLPLPEVDLITDLLQACVPMIVNFSDLSIDAVSWDWNLGDGTTSNVKDLTHIYTQPGVYDVSLTISSSLGCSNTLTNIGMIEVFALPVADFIPTPTQGTQAEALFNFNNTSSNAISWMWDFGDGSASIDEFPSHLFSDTGWHKVSLIAISAEGCMDTLENEVYIAPNLSIFFPNAFTPNGDYHNDFFGGVGQFEAIKEFELMIFNRWGELIYITDDPTLPWNGRKYNLGGNPLSPDGVYVYTALIRDFMERQFEFKGTFILLSNQ